jgi:hypothetical protein
MVGLSTNRLQQQWATGDRLAVMVRIGQTHEQVPFPATSLPEVCQKPPSIAKRPGTGSPILEAEFTVIGAASRSFIARLSSDRGAIMGRADARRATTLNPARANAAAVPVKIFDVLFGALVSIG